MVKGVSIGGKKKKKKSDRGEKKTHLDLYIINEQRIISHRHSMELSLRQFLAYPLITAALS